MSNIRMNLRNQSQARRKLTVEQVQEMRKLNSEGRTVRELAAQYGVCRSTVQDIVTGRVWRGVGLLYGGDK